MALILSNNELRGVYEGQGANAISIGSISGYPDDNIDSPFIIGFYLSDDSININAFFDPTKSTKIQNNYYNKIGIIQIGQLTIDSIPAPISVYQLDNLYSNNNKYFELFGTLSNSAWVDIPAENASGNRITTPLFPYWGYSEDSNLLEKNLYFYPQTYGGLTRFDGTGFQRINRVNGENLSTYLTGNYTLDSGTLPTQLSIEEYIDTINVSNYYSTLTNLDSGSFKDLNYFATILNTLNQEGLIPFLAGDLTYNINKRRRDGNQNTYTTLATGDVTKYTGYYSKVIASESRLYLEYIINPELPERNDNLVRILLYPNPNNPDKLAFFHPDDDFMDDFQDAAAESAPSSAAVSIKMQNDYKISTQFKNASDLKLTYDFCTCACSIIQPPANGAVTIQLLENFSWGVSNHYTEENQWGNLIISKQPTSNTKSIGSSPIWNMTMYDLLKKNIEIYYENLYGKNFRVHFIE